MQQHTDLKQQANLFILGFIQETLVEKQTHTEDKLMVTKGESGEG